MFYKYIKNSINEEISPSMICDTSQVCKEESNLAYIE